MAASNASTSQPLLTADGTPLKTSLQRSMRRSKLRAAMLVLPPLAFLLALFIFPIGNLLTRSTDDVLINHQLPLTFAILDYHILSHLLYTTKQFVLLLLRYNIFLTY